LCAAHGWETVTISGKVDKELYSMQNAKDSFYMALRTRLTTINPERTILLRGAVRPGILVEEAEAPFSQLPNDVFVLRWLGLGVDMDLAPRWRPSSARFSIRPAERRALAGWTAAGAERDGRGTDGDAAAVLHAQAQLHGNAAGIDADAGVLGRAGFTPIVIQRDR
jgi:hypothetical protein